MGFLHSHGNLHGHPAGRLALQYGRRLCLVLGENAVKHGIASLPNGGDLSVRAAINADSLRLEVENTGCLSAPKPGTTQVGLGNTRERLRILYGARAHLKLRNGDGRVTATVVIPRTL